MSADPFGTAAVRERVLAGWAASGDRFREDANAEEDLALGGYRDRLVVELAQNAADAASRAGVPGRLLLSLRELADGPVLVAANTGSGLDAAGVRALATLRASAKRERDSGAVGRFGVGFAAVLAVSDEPAVISRTGGVRFSRADTHALVRRAAEASPVLAEELDRRDDHVPVLRLPFEAAGTPPDGYDTAVLLPLRNSVAEDLVSAQLAEVGDALLLALPALDDVVVELPGTPERRVSGVAARWHVLRCAGEHDPAALADRPTEERHRPGWSLTWALPATGAAALPGVVHAPTPTEEPLTLPAMLIASFPLDPTRRHVAPGPATDRLVDAAAQAYADLLSERARDGADVLGLVPTGLAGGALDGRLRTAALARLRAASLLPAVEDPALLLRPTEAVALDGSPGSSTVVLQALAPALAGLVAADRAGRAALEALGVRRLTLGDVVDELPVDPDPVRWHRLYAALSAVADDPMVRDALGSLPVPLADGRVVRGPRGLMLPEGTATAGSNALAVLGPYGLRVVHPQAAHLLLERLGSVPVTARAVLEDPAVGVAVRDSPDADDPAALADAVLALVSDAVSEGGLSPGDLPVLGDLALSDSDGALAPATALALPGSVAAQVLDPEEIGLVDADLLRRWGEPALLAVGVLDSLAVHRAFDVPLDDPEPEQQPRLDRFEDWLDEVVEPAVEEAGLDPAPVLTELVALADLDVVKPQAWVQVLHLVARDSRLRAALVTPARISDGRRAVDVLPYTAWWLRRHARVDGAALHGCCEPGGDPLLRALLDPLPASLQGLDPDARRALGIIRDVADLAGPDGAAVELVLHRLTDPARLVEPRALLRLWAQLAYLGDAVPPVDAPSRVRVLDRTATGTAVVDAARAAVVDAPMWWQRGDLDAAVIAPAGLAEGLADLLDLPLTSELAPGRVEDGGRRTAVPDVARDLLPSSPATWCRHDRLVVDGHEVDWWVEGAGDSAVLHAVDTRGLARALAQAAGAWGRRFLVVELLAQPEQASALMTEDALG